MPGCAAVILRVASNPSMPRIRTSIRITSGRRRSAISIAASPFELSPMTAISRSRARIILTPSRTAAWSSTTSTRTCSVRSSALSASWLELMAFTILAAPGERLETPSRTVPRMSTARRTALISFLAAIALAVTKLGVGLATSSLGILAAAALLSLYAVGVAERPPDARHQYGHGKAQHLGALFEALFLAAFAVWIAIEAVLRLRSGGGDVQAHWYAFVLMGVVLVVDAGRATVSLRTGRSERNAALIASAWHFAS